MPFALVVIGLIMIVSAARDTNAALGNQIVTDFTGSGNFTYWLVAIGVVGSIGYVEKLKPFSHAFLTLLIISFIVSNGGVFDKLNEALKSGPVAPNKNPAAPGSASAATDPVASVAASVQAGIAANSGSDASKNFGTVIKIGETLAKLF